MLYERSSRWQVQRWPGIRLLPFYKEWGRHSLGWAQTRQVENNLCFCLYAREERAGYSPKWRGSWQMEGHMPPRGRRMPVCCTVVDHMGGISALPLAERMLHSRGTHMGNPSRDGTI